MDLRPTKRDGVMTVGSDPAVVEDEPSVIGGTKVRPVGRQVRVLLSVPLADLYI